MPWQLFEGNLDKISGLQSGSPSDRSSSGNGALLFEPSLPGNDSSVLAAKPGTVSNAEFLARIVSLLSIVISVCSLLVKVFKKARQGRFANGMVSRLFLSVYSILYCIAVTVKLLGTSAKAICYLNVKYLSREAVSTSPSTPRPLSVERDDPPSSLDATEPNSSSDVDSATAQKQSTPKVRRPVRIIRSGGLLNAAMRLVEKQEDSVKQRIPLPSSRNTFPDDADTMGHSEETVTWEVGTKWKRRKGKDKKDWRVGQTTTWVRDPDAACEAEMRETEEEERAVESLLTCIEKHPSTTSSEDIILLNPKLEQDESEQQIGRIACGSHSNIPAVPVTIQEFGPVGSYRNDRQTSIFPGIGALSGMSERTSLTPRISLSSVAPMDVEVAQVTTQTATDSGAEAAAPPHRRERRRGCRGSKINKRAAAAAQAQLASD